MQVTVTSVLINTKKLCIVCFRARRAAKEAKEAPAQPAPAKVKVEVKKFVKIGRPGYKGEPTECLYILIYLIIVKLQMLCILIYWSLSFLFSQ